MLSYIGWLRGWISFQKSEKDFQQKGISKGVWIILEWIWGKSCSWLPENEKNIGYRIFRSQKQNINIKSILNDIRLPRIDFQRKYKRKGKEIVFMNGLGPQVTCGWHGSVKTPLVVFLDACVHNEYVLETQHEILGFWHECNIS